MKHFALAAIALLVLLASACGGRAGDAGDAASAGSAASASAAVPFDRLPRAVFNRRAAELDLPVFWRDDADGDGALDPGELAVLWGEVDTTELEWVDGGRFTPRMVEAYERMTASDDLAQLPPEEQRRRRAVLAELAQGRPTLVETDLTRASAEDRAIVENVMEAARVIERIHAKQNGVDAFATQLGAADPASRHLFHRNQGPHCRAPKTEKDADCSALPSRPKKISGLYPANIQSGTDTAFCQALEQRKDADALLAPFVVVRAKAGGKSEGNAATDDLEPVPYTVAYAAEMKLVAERLKAAADVIQDLQETAFKTYLEAAATAFGTGDWQPADEAWAKMSATNSKWYLRIAPDEVYFEPCSRKAGFHVSFARINPGSLEWQQKLEPLKGEMEQALATLAGPPYAAHPVSFHLPDFIDIVLNAGDSRDPLGGTIGQSLPNWGPVANEGRGRTVAMVNLSTDKDSEDAWKDSVASLFCNETAQRATFDPALAVMSTVLHEAAHNLGPAHEYKVNGKTDDQILGGPMSSTLEELKAQTAALYFADWLVDKGVVDQQAAEGAHLRDVAWAFGHIAQGLYDAEGKPKAYSQLASIQLGTLHKAGVLEWKADIVAANGKDRGCIQIDLAKWKPAVAELAQTVLRVKGAGDKAGAEQLKKQLVDDPGAWAELRGVITERWLRQPKGSYVYAVKR